MRLRCLLALLVLVSCGESESEREEKALKEAVPQRVQSDGTIRLSDADRTALGLVVEPAQEGDLPDIALRYGRTAVRPGEDVLVVAPMAGRVHSASTVLLGARVEKGTPLVELVPVLGAAERVSIDVQRAELDGQVKEAERELALRETELVRARDLEKDRIVSTAKLQESEAAAATTRARLEALRQARGVQWRGAAGPITLRAPVDGLVVSVGASLGASVSSGEVLARILRPGPRWVDVAVAPNEPPGDAYEVAVGTQWIAARLISRGAVLEEDGSRHDRLEVEAEAGAVLVPGATVPVRIARGAAHGVVLPETAVVPAVGGGLVYVEVENGFAARRVKIAARFGGKVRVSGVKSGDRVVVMGAMGLRGESLRSELRAE